MVKNALGLIEVVGLAAGMTAADAAVKAANVELIGYELAKGGGMVVIKVCGDVGAVKAAVDAGSVAAARINKVVAKHVIPRPHTELAGLILTRETVGCKPDQAAPANAAPSPAGTAISPVALSKPVQADSETAADEPAPATAETPEPETASFANPPETCNMCGDPACPRKKGDPRITCIHYEKNNKEDE